MIREGRITINGRVAELGDKIDPGYDAVKVDGRRVAVEKVAPRSYYLLNKPGGYVSTRDDPEGRPTVLDLLPERLRKGLFPVGRLDFETEGLLILTDDGDLALRLTHPRYGSFKTYEVKVKGHPQDAAIQKLRSGIVLEGRRTAPVQISRLQGVGGMREAVQSSWWQVILKEGRTRQIREMFFRIGHPVRRLRRVAISGLRDPKLRLGTWRELTEQEIAGLRQPPKLPAAKAEGGSGPGRRARPAGAGGPGRKRRPDGGGSPRQGPSRGGPSRGGRDGRSGGAGGRTTSRPGSGKGGGQGRRPRPGGGPRRG